MASCITGTYWWVWGDWFREVRRWEDTLGQVMRAFFDIDGTLLDHKLSERAGVFEFYRNHINVFRNLREEEFYKLWCGISINILLGF